jgi:hypothetical protein
MHFLARAAAEYHHSDRWSATLCCNNLRALEMLSHHRRGIRPSAKCADICHSLRMTKQLLHGAFQYVHVHGHMNRFLQWEQLTLTQQLNCVKEDARVEGVSARFGVDLELASDLTCGIEVSEMAECWEKVQRTSARPHIDLVPGGNGTGMHLTRADT